jgi:hypothetical protein
MTSAPGHEPSGPARVPGHEPSGPVDVPGHEPSGPAGGPGPGRSGPPGSRGGPDGGFGDDLADWGLDLGREPPSEEELHGVVFDPGNSPVEGWEVMSDAQRRELLGGDLYPGQDGEDGQDAAAEALEAGFTHRHGGTGSGFAAGGPLDVMLPGPGLAWHAGAARQRGLGALSDDELIGLLGAARRLSSWSAGLNLAGVIAADKHLDAAARWLQRHGAPGTIDQLRAQVFLARLAGHLIKIRSPRCGYPGCRRPATRCDDDHTIPHHKGGRTCECNLHPLCRQHHQAKQAPGWHLSQPEPGILTWTTPSGRRYTVAPEPYPS